MPWPMALFKSKLKPQGNDPAAHLSSGSDYFPTG